MNDPINVFFQDRAQKQPMVSYPMWTGPVPSKGDWVVFDGYQGEVTHLEWSLLTNRTRSIIIWSRRTPKPGTPVAFV